MTNTPKIRAQMEVVDYRGNHVGTVDVVEGLSIKLTRTDPDAKGMHHYIPFDWVQSIGDALRLNRSREEAQKQWHVEPFARSL